MTNTTDLIDSPLDRVIGQRPVVERLKLYTRAKGRLPNVFLSASSGMGKSHICHAFGDHAKAHVHRINGGDINDKIELTRAAAKVVQHATLNPEERSILFVDEVGELKKRLQVPLLDALEKPFHIITEIKTGPHKGTHRLNIPENMSFMFATTDEGRCHPALMTRSHKVGLIDYSVDEMMEIGGLYLKSKGYSCTKEALRGLATISRNIRQLKNICDTAAIYNKRITHEIFLKVADQLQVTATGLTRKDTMILTRLSERMYVSMPDLCAYADVEKEEYERIERFLIRRELIEKSTHGRSITNKGLGEIGLDKRVADEDFYLGEKIS